MHLLRSQRHLTQPEIKTRARRRVVIQGYDRLFGCACRIFPPGKARPATKGAAFSSHYRQFTKFAQPFLKPFCGGAMCTAQ
jgi:hypothetical protein